MPQAPNVDGLPVWLQIAVTVVFGLVTLGVGMRGYLRPAGPSSDQTQTTFAHLADMGAIRHLAEVNHQLCSEVVSLERAISDHAHYLRQQMELQRELCQRMRELRDRLDRGVS